MNKEGYVVAFESWVRVPVTLAGAKGVFAAAAEAIGYIEMR